jgi:Tfp pilus assembly protein PilO
MPMFKNIRMKDFTKERYLAMTKAFPRMQQEQTQAYFMLSLTFISLSFLGVFAINPTLTTIFELNKKLEDSKFVDQALKTKMANLSALHDKYAALQSDWPKVNAAVPNNPQTAYLLGQMQAIAEDTGVKVVDLQSFEVELTKQSEGTLKESSYVYSVSVTGDTPQLVEFLQAVTSFDRVIGIESVILTDEGRKILTIQARTFFTP